VSETRDEVTSRRGESLENLASRGPDIRGRIVGNRRKIVSALLLAFVVRVVATYDVKGWSSGKKPAIKSVDIGAQNLVAWALLAVMLSVASDMESTSDLAVAFAFLILIATLMVSGLDAIRIINTAIASGKKAKPTNVGAGGADASSGD
jgi:hypothetical protein